MQIIDIQERDYNNHIKKKNNHALNKTTINNSCYGKKNNHALNKTTINNSCYG